MSRQAETGLRLVRCLIGNEAYYLEMSWIKNIQRIDGLRSHGALARAGEDIPARCEGALGFVSGLEGDTPVFSLAKLLKRPLKETVERGMHELKRIIVLNIPDNEPGLAMALLVDRVSQVVTIPTERSFALPEFFADRAENCFQAIVDPGENMALLLDPAKLVAAALNPRDNTGTSTETSTETDEREVPATGTLPEFTKSSASSPEKKEPGRMIIFSAMRPSADKRSIVFGLSISQVCEILRPLPVLPLPMSPSFLLGFIHWRKRPVPVINLPERLGLQYKEHALEHDEIRFMIVRGPGNGSLVGFPVRTEIRSQSLPILHTACKKLPDMYYHLAGTIVELKKETLIVPDIARLVAPA